jgi:hypothetical protein
MPWLRGLISGDAGHFQCSDLIRRLHAQGAVYVDKDSHPVRYRFLLFATGHRARCEGQTVQSCSGQCYVNIANVSVNVHVES